MSTPARPPPPSTPASSPWDVFVVFLRLGLTSFGGPVAHLGYFRQEFVERRRWLSDVAYAELVALCQFMPGPASSQVGLGIGLMRAGHLGSAAAWIGFTLPSAIAMFLFAVGIASVEDAGQSGWLRGLKVVAVAIVAHAVLGMAKSFSRGLWQGALTVVAAGIVLRFPGFTGQIGAILLGALMGVLLAGEGSAASPSDSLVQISRRAGWISLSLFAALFALTPVAASLTDLAGLQIFDGFFRTGSLVFGGGHVVLPLLQAVVVEPGWVTEDQFLAGYSAAQAIPGPLFTFAAYLGAAQSAWPSPAMAACVAIAAIFLPSFLLVTGLLPFWQRLREYRQVAGAMVGVNAAVVGLLLAAFYSPVFTAGISSLEDLILAVLGFAVLAGLRWPAWSVVLIGAIIGLLRGAVGQ